MKTIAWEKLNQKIQDGKIVCYIDDGYHGELRVKEWRWLEPFEDYNDPSDDEYRDMRGEYCGLVAYVEEFPEHIPYGCIDKITIGELKEVGLK